MSSKTTFLGLELLAPGEPESTDGYQHTSKDPATIDRAAQFGVRDHKHDGHAAMADPTAAPTVALASTGGSIDSGTTLYVAYTLTDSQGGETLPTDPVIQTTTAGYADPDNAPTQAVDYVSGSLLAASYLYAITVTDGAGGETALGPAVLVTVEPGHANAEVTLSGLTTITNDSSGSSTSAGWRLWRSIDGGSTWNLMSTGAYSTDSWVDDGSTSGDCSQSPPDQSTTVGTSTLTVTVPSAGQPSGATFFSIYACEDGQFLSPSLLGTYPVSDYDVAQTFTSLSLLDGQPPATSQAFPGANQITPHTDIAQDGATDGQALVWNASAGQWQPATTADSGDLQSTNNLSDLANADTSRLNLHVPALSPAQCVATSNIATRSGLLTIDGYTLVAGDHVLLVGQTAASQNGVWVAASGAWTRPDEFPSGGSVTARTCAIINGTAEASTQWLLAVNSAVTIDTNVQPWHQLNGSAISGIEVTDGTNTETGVTEINFTSGATVSSGGAGIADVAITGGGASGLGLTPTALKSANYTAAPNDLVLCSIAGGSFTVTLPSGPADKTLIGVEVAVGGGVGFGVTVALGAGDHFYYMTGGPTTLSLAPAGQSVLLQYDATYTSWQMIGAHRPPDVMYGAASLDNTGRLLPAELPTSVVSMDSGTAPQIDHTTALVNGNVLYYDSASGKFKGEAVSGGTQPDWYNALQNGVVGNGTTDDTTALQSLLNTAAGVGVVFIPQEAVVLISSTVTVPSNTVLLCAGTIKWKTGTGKTGTTATMLAMTGSSTNVLIDGMGTGILNGQSEAVFGINSNLNGTTDKCAHLTVRDLDVRNINGWGLNHAGNDTLFANITYHDSLQAWLVVGASLRVRIENSTAYNITNDWGIAIFNGCQDVVVQNCVAHHCAQQGMGVSNGTGCDNIKFIGCTAYSNTMAGFIAFGQTGQNHTRIQFIGCTARSNNTGNGTPGSIVNNGANYFIDFASWVDVIACRSEVVGNGSNGGAGLYATNASYLMIDKFSSYNEGQGSTVGYGIYLDASVTNAQIIDPHILDDQGVKTMASMVNATADITNGKVAGGILGAARSSVINGVAHFLGGVSNVTGYGPISARAVNTSAQSLAAGGFSKILLNTATYDALGSFDLVTNHRYNVPVAGQYLVTAAFEAAPSANRFFAAIYKNGSIHSQGGGGQGSSSNPMDCSVSDVLQCAAGDYIEFYGYNGSGSTVALDWANPQIPYMSVTRIA